MPVRNKALDEPKIKNRLEQLKTCDGLNVELVGWWIWVWGSTQKHKPVLDLMGFAYSVKREKFFFKGKESSRKFKKPSNWSYDKIKRRHGDVTIRKQDEK